MFSRIITGLWTNAKRVVSGKSLLWHAVAIALTAVFVLSGFDWWFYEATRSELLNPIVWIAGIGGFFAPIFIIVGMYIVGEIRNDERLIRIALAVAQAVLIGLAVAFVYKAFTGRIQPDFMYMIGDVDNSRDFNFGWFRHGVFWGWPSSHTIVAVAGGTVLLKTVMSVPIKGIVLLYMGIVAIGAGVGFHWFSDVVAGGILGVLIGMVVSKSLINRL